MVGEGLCRGGTYKTCVSREGLEEESLRPREQAAQRPWGGDRPGPVQRPRSEYYGVAVRARVLGDTGDRAGSRVGSRGRYKAVSKIIKGTQKCKWVCY